MQATSGYMENAKLIEYEVLRTNDKSKETVTQLFRNRGSSSRSNHIDISHTESSSSEEGKKIKAKSEKRSSDIKGSPRTLLFPASRSSSSSPRNYDVESLKEFESLEDKIRELEDKIKVINNTLYKEIPFLIQKFKENDSILEKPEIQIPSYCFQRIYEEYLKESPIKMQTFQMTMKKMLLGELANPAVLLSPSLDRLKIVYKYTMNFLKENSSRSDFSSILIYHLEKLIYANSLASFLFHLNEIEPCKRPNPLTNLLPSMNNQLEELQVKDIIFACLGRTPAEVKSLLKLLRQWQPIGEKALEAEIDKRVFEITELLMNTPMSYSWKNDISFLKSIPIHEIRRRWKMEERILLPKISILNSITGKEININFLEEGKKEKLKSEEISDGKLYELLLTGISQCGLDKGILPISKQIGHLIDLIRISILPEKKRLPEEATKLAQAQRYVSYLPLLLLTTMTSLGEGEKFLYNNFPHLFSINACGGESSALFQVNHEGLNCNIILTPPGYKVKFIQNVSIYPYGSLKKSDQKENNALGKLKYCFSIGVSNEELIAQIEILEIKMHPYHLEKVIKILSAPEKNFH